MRRDKMNNVKVFKNPSFGDIRTMEFDGKILFAASDIAKALGYSNPRDAILRHCKSVEKYDTLTGGGVQEINFIPEGDVYRLIVHSKLPSTERFERWVFDDVLPSINKHGAYMTESTIEQALTNPDFLIKLATQLKEEKAARLEAEKTIEEQKPKVLFADAVATSKTSILIGELAKLIKQNGVDIGQNRLFSWMRENGFLFKNKNEPTQQAMDRGLFEVKERTINNPDGTVRITRTVKVTGKGQTYFINRFLGKKGAVTV